jgi:hypothetical protein
MGDWGRKKKDKHGSHQLDRFIIFFAASSQLMGTAPPTSSPLSDNRTAVRVVSIGNKSVKAFGTVEYPWITILIGCYIR